MEALYTRYRPGSFSEVRGQEHATDALVRALESGRLHHAYLFSGPRGCGKTSSARILAMSINCESGPTPTPCGTCVQCIDIRKGISMDVIEIDAATNGLVDDARDLRERVLFAPSSARSKVYIIDEAHMLSAGASNALLKVVEEPPPHVRFIFATTEPDKILPTIRSRTFHYHFRLVPPKQLIAHLRSICDLEKIEVDPAVLPLVAAAGGGSVRDSMSILDQLFAGAGKKGVEYAPAVALLGVTDAALIDEAAAALGARDGASLFAAVDRAISAGHDPRRFAQDLLVRIRDLLVIEAVPDADERGLLESVPADARERMRAQAAALGGAELSRAGDVLHAGLVEMRGTTNPRLLLELICARMLLPGADTGALALRLDRVERGIAVGAVPAAAVSPPPVREATSPAPVREAPPLAETPRRVLAPGPESPATEAQQRPVEAASPGGSVDFGRLQVMWPQIVEATKSRKRATHALLSVYARLVAADADTVTVQFELAPIARQYQSGVNIDVTREAIAEVLGYSPRVTVVVGEAPAGLTPPEPVETYEDAPASPAPKKAALADPDATMDDEDLPDMGSGEDAALSMLQSGLGATVVSRVDSDI